MYFNYLFIVKILVAAILGALIGLERKTKHFGLGARTAALITLTSCAFTLTGMTIFDPTNVARVVQGLAAGVGFIGAAIIWKQTHDHAVIGITTAVTVWALTAIGIIVALGFYLEVVLLTLIILIILFLKRLGVE
ncbi:MAG: MgtC/SapB family protein [Candidatus Pacearchaeota archaeon]